MRLGLPARIFATLLKVFPSKIGDRMWRWWYQRLAKAKAWGEFGFMNYGFIDDNPPILDPEDESDRLFIQLYHMNIRDVELNGKEVLEIGSGRGGGANWIARTYSPQSLTALDYSGAAVKLCNRMYGRQENLQFVEGNAMSLSFEDESYDIIYNVESSHCYSNMSQFISEAYRVLRPGGHFAWTDFRDKKTMESIHKQFLSTGFEIELQSDITEEVVSALDQVSDDKQSRIKNGTNVIIRRSFETFAGVRNTPVYDAFIKGDLGYYRYLLRK
ncbi:MAG: class I SAM-dependent methyltransferase [Candidatus Thalassarchaeaceae archaeon]|nr:MAG: class I SAM-dependent methyltransferase [Euryarchaeota archaeon]RPG74789.1 MAG: class I SAM-dependent methyltransferase [Euryarchaeota archaeon TMED85]|tara:strand:+ start:1055 stop:1870 length:816 start_codon:yes stop_codon:yes gene_type:complete